MTEHLTLSSALKSGRLEDFIRQQEAAGVGPATESHVLEAIAKVAKSGKSAGRTSRLPSAGGSTGR
jgi:hypothetical protein